MNWKEKFIKDEGKANKKKFEQDTLENMMFELLGDLKATYSKHSKELADKFRNLSSERAQRLNTLRAESSEIGQQIIKYFELLKKKIN